MEDNGPTHAAIGHPAPVGGGIAVKDAALTGLPAARRPRGQREAGGRGAVRDGPLEAPALLCARSPTFPSHWRGRAPRRPPSTVPRRAVAALASLVLALLLSSVLASGPAHAAGAGRVVGPHSDVGGETNGDPDFNYLRGHAG